MNFIRSTVEKYKDKVALDTVSFSGKILLLFRSGEALTKL